ncbi:MAG: pilus assembly protein [Chloroflexi bacterium]|nr:pilus assembly protein [Chloroflexota bacterium]
MSMQESAQATQNKRLRTSLRRFFGDKRGQSLVEFGLMLPILVLLVLGAIDFGRVYFAYISVTNGARNGADYASLGSAAADDLDGIRAAAVADTSDLVNISPTNPSVSSASGTDSQGRLYSDVTVSYTFTTIFPWPGLPSSINVERTVRARVAE